MSAEAPAKKETQEIVPAANGQVARPVSPKELWPTDIAADPKLQEAVAWYAKQYGLDPLRNHILVLGSKPYVTAEGMKYIALTSGMLDGIELEWIADNPKQSRYTVRALVYRKDASRPFCDEACRHANNMPTRVQKFGREAAITHAIARAMRNAFAPGLLLVDDFEQQRREETAQAETPALPEPDSSEEGQALDTDIKALINEINKLNPGEFSKRKIESTLEGNARDMAGKKSLRLRLKQRLDEFGAAEDSDPDDEVAKKIGEETFGEEAE